jgi:ribosomal protein L37E
MSNPGDPCRRCGKPIQLKRKALCNACLAENKRVDRASNPEVKKSERRRYQDKKNDPDFQEKNRARARAWNKKKREEKKRGKG